ncbi:hypothetical protein MASR2M15_24450 [Anaerolineales bacterium]
MVKEQKAVLIPDYLTVKELSDLIDASPIEVMKKLIANGVMVSINQQIDFDTAAIVMGDLGYVAESVTAVAEAEVEKERADAQNRKFEQIYADEAEKDLETRAPVVTILGHVDHGKTTLLDAIRHTSVAQGEAGGITQHIGAYQVKHNDRSITFLDTPGHEAFTAMRARGAQGADIAILVVAADDGVMPTTREALDHARAANIPIVVAITKVDRNNANPDRVRQQLAELNLVSDEWDGDTMMIPVSAPQNQGLDDLLEAILLVADDNRIVANTHGIARGVIIEAEKDKFRGTVATLLVLNGTLRTGDAILAGTSYGRIRAMFDAYGKQIKEAGPSTPVSVLGLNEPPLPGEQFQQVDSDKEGRRMAEDLILNQGTISALRTAPLTLEDLFAHFQSGEAKELNLIIKVDVQGSIQPIIDSLGAISEQNEEGIGIRVLSSDVGNIGENDINLASASNAIIIGFNVQPDSAARRSAENQGVDIRHYKIIYKLLEDIELALHGMLEPKYEEKVIGTAEVRQIFRIPRIGVIAGSYIIQGEARRNAKGRVIRNNEVIVKESNISSLKRFEEDVREVRQGFECGIGLANFDDFKEGDKIEFFVVQKVT